MVLKILSKLLRKVELFRRRSVITDLLETERLSIGHGTYQYELLQIDNYKGSEAKVVIGNYCSLAKNITIITGGIHPPNYISTYPFRIRLGMEGAYIDGIPSSKGDVVIGNDVWIGTNATILSGVNIGSGAIIAANCIVTKDVPDYAIVAGNPGKIIKFRFSRTQISQLMVIKWWNWDIQKIRDNVALLSHTDIDLFIEKHNIILK